MLRRSSRARLLLAALRPPPEFHNLAQGSLFLACNALLFVGAADRNELAVGAAILARRGRKRAIAKGIVDLVQNSFGAFTRVLRQANGEFNIAAPDGGIEKARLGDGLLQSLRNRHCV